MSVSSSPQSRPVTSQRWRRLVPLVFITYSLAYLDRSNYSVGVDGGGPDAMR